MSVKDLIEITLTAFSYYFFSNEFFKFSAEIKEKRVSYLSRLLGFLFVYFWFILASYLELPLAANWFIFLLILGLEVCIVFSFDFTTSYTISLFCVIMSLSVNIFFRSLASVIMKVPMNVFDNSLSSLKVYPIFLGFTAMIILFYILRRYQFFIQLKRMLRYRKSLVFYFWTEFFIFLFLIIQLLAFSNSGYETGIKIWGIKSSLFSVIVLVVTIVYSYRVASLHYYMQKQHETRDHLIQEKKDINNLWALAYTDMLTGCNNRHLLNKRLKEYAGYGGSITLAFIDVNGLKIINDRFGHMEGDHYLIRIAKILSEISSGRNIDLFRYGGDEFIMLSDTLSETEFTDLLIQVNQKLKAEAAPYSRSISYGVVHGDCADYPGLIADADHLMYNYKLNHYKTMARN